MASHCRTLKYEDTVQCSLYSLEKISHISGWEKLLESINEFISSLSHEYIWHRDDFKLCMSIFEENTKGIPCFLTSTTCFGDNIEDEWFIIYLILEITKKYQNIIAQVEDNDGDFLLIEAENYLPSWANPDSTENRVYIYKGKIHLIDPTIIPLNSTLQIVEALELVKEKSQKTEAPFKIQNAIFERIGNYPQKIKTIFHSANVTLPIEIAAVLSLKPSLISPIVTSYCNLDSLDMKYCNDLLQLNSNVTLKVKFTKYLYAMLLHSKPIQHDEIKNTDKDKRKQLGIKLAYGYNVIKKTPSKDEFSSLEYKKFIKSLTNNGYFKNNLEGSKDYKKLLAKANEYFLNNESSIPSHVNSLISKLQATEEFKESIQKLSNLSNVDFSEDDNDDWLNVNPNQLNDLLSSKYGYDKNARNEILTSQLTSFLNKTSDFEGIDKRDDNIIEDDDAIEFDAEEFVQSLDKMLKLVSNDSNVINDIDSDDDDILCDDEDDNVDLDEELSCKLHDPSEFGNRFQAKHIANNLRQSLREEDLTGPTSNMLKTIGINKTDVLDSDDE